ncbi:glycoside hydrolase family 10 protein [Pedosphaera parvula]|uniref:Glycosyl hydrolase-like 10 domain-containing protein n=1 Tax=Pedosphaera parvula (strain Ellin514) TaxID=320771 RepID=B9XDT4_PEDPL|nr:family 10 glycosylhydrolase [Pedosphaera parvula]EEF61825.1 protein of unknown function DUF187 [Pedosphaera parvula Ellin514]
MNSIRLVAPALCLLLLTATVLPAADTSYKSSSIKPPAVQREFRAGWVATVANIDWPSRPDLPVDQQKAEMVAIMENAQKTHLNAIVFQVRPACDAMYASTIEPWSYYLTGAMGKPPEPFYDPLQFAIEEAHKRGLELHAWFNPYRAAHPSDKSPIAATHISQTHPNLVKKYGKYLWLDPGEKEVQDYSINVVMDVVKRYDVDGVHMDDYFYPYKETDEDRHQLDFPDEDSWKRYQDSGGKMNRADWRRENVNVLVQRLYQSVKATKPWVKVGFAPFGIWQPGVPTGIKRGFDAYNVLYCDPQKWLQNGWMDYCAPQLYWAIEPSELSFTSLLKWWTEQNTKNRNIWPGIDSGKFAERSPQEIPNQIKITREISKGTAGVIHWSYKCLLNDRGGLATTLEKGLYAEPAIVPASPWLEHRGPGKPELTLFGGSELCWETSGKEKISVWVLQTRSGDKWSTTILPGDTLKKNLAENTEVVSITAIDRCGLASLPVVLEKTTASAQ